MPTFLVKNGKTEITTIPPWSNTCSKCGHDELEVRQRGIWITDSCPGHSWYAMCPFPDSVLSDHCHVKCTKCGHKTTTRQRRLPPLATMPKR